MHSMSLLARVMRLAGLSLVAVACASPAVDAPVPHGYEAVVDGARTSLRQNMEGFFQPNLAFVEVRCFAGGGRVVLFREASGANAGRVDWAMQGAGAAPGADGWSGGFGEAGMAQEVAFNFPNQPLVACPPR